MPHWTASSWLLCPLCAVGLFVGAPRRAGSEETPPRDAPIKIVVDARDITRRVVTSRLAIPARPGPLTLRFPEWVPGAHGPLGPIGRLGGIKIFTGNRSIEWKRDPRHLFSFHLLVPEGASVIEAELAYVLQGRADYLEVSLGIAASNAMAVINWNPLVLYPAGTEPARLAYQAKLLLPAGWKMGTALSVAHERAGEVAFNPVSLEQLIDSPVLAGKNLERFTLPGTGTVPHYLVLAREDGAQKDMPDNFLNQLSQLANEAGTLFGGKGYRSFHFLLGLSDQIPNFGLEHHECTVNTASPRAWRGDAAATWWLTFLLAHEYVHSWNGKHRRAADMMARDFNTPLQTDLLWVYEGLTQYLGWVLDARSGLWTKQQFRDELAITSANLDRPIKRSWRNVLDTAIAAPLHTGVRGLSWRGQSDFYYEGALIWLEADTIIRSRTNGTRSLDDFCGQFFKAHQGRPIVVAYTFDDVTQALGRVVAHDWPAFFRSRLLSTGPRAPLSGIKNSGWRLAYAAEPCAKVRSTAGTDLSYSIGVLLSDGGQVTDVLYGSPAWNAGVAPGMEIHSVNGRGWTRRVFAEILGAARQGDGQIRMEVSLDKKRREIVLSYRGGPRFPRLENVPGRYDMLEEILRPRTARVGVQGSP